MGWSTVKTILFSVIVVLAVFTVSVVAVFGAGEKAVYICDGGNGDGTSAENAAGDFKAAVRQLSETGGDIVICGKYTFDELVVLSEKSGTSNGDKTIRVTSVRNGIDYRKSDNAAIYIGDGKNSGNIILDGRFIFEELDIVSKDGGKQRSVICGGWETVFGDGIKCKKEGNSSYLSVVGGNADDSEVKGGRLTVKSGTYYKVCCGNPKGGYRGDTYLKIDGGTFEGSVSVSGNADGVHRGNAFLEINGGTFYGSVGTLTEISGDLEMTVNGGTFRKDMYALGKYNTLNINGGNLQSIGQIMIADYIPPVPEADGDGKAVETNAEEVKKTAVNINYYSGDVNKLKEKIKGEGVEINVNTLGGIDAETAPLQIGTTELPKDTQVDVPDDIYEETVPEEPSDNTERYYLLETKEKTVFVIIGIGAITALSVIILAYRSVYRKK